MPRTHRRVIRTAHHEDFDRDLPVPGRIMWWTRADHLRRVSGRAAGLRACEVGSSRGRDRGEGVRRCGRSQQLGPREADQMEPGRDEGRQGCGRRRASVGSLERSPLRADLPSRREGKRHHRDPRPLRRLQDGVRRGAQRPARAGRRRGARGRGQGGRPVLARRIVGAVPGVLAARARRDAQGQGRRPRSRQRQELRRARADVLAQRRHARWGVAFHAFVEHDTRR